MTNPQIPPGLASKPAGLILFLQEINDVCKKHGLSISHEDYQGSFLLTNYNRRNRDWLWAARLDLKRPIQPSKALQKPKEPGDGHSAPSEG